MSEWVEVTDPDDLVMEALPPVEEIRLDEFTNICSMCSSESLEREYHPAGVMGAICSMIWPMPLLRRLGPHQCVRCERCRYTTVQETSPSFMEALERAARETKEEEEVTPTMGRLVSVTFRQEGDDDD